jgi:transposase-like protein
VTIYRWVQRFTLLLADAARPCRHAVRDRWQVDETHVKVAGHWRCVYRAIDQFGQIIDVFVSARRDADAAFRFFEQALRTTIVEPTEVITDQVPVCPAVLEELYPASRYRRDRYANNRVECDHGRLTARLPPCEGSSRTAAPGSSWRGRRWCRTSGVDTTSWRLRRPRPGGWPSRSTSWPWRSDPSPTHRFSMRWGGTTKHC